MENQTTTNLSIVEVDGVHGYVDEKGTAWLNVEDVARGLGFVEVKKGRVATSGDTVTGSCDKPYTAIRWARINGYLKEFGIAPVNKGDYIPEHVFYLLAMKASNEVAKKFQWKVATEIMPSIRKYGYYSLTNETAPAVTADEKPDLARVYLLQLSDGTVQIVKIGHSKNIRSRVAKIKRETGLTVVDMYFTPYMPRDNARFVEWASQEVLSAWRVKGEIFSVNFSKARATIRRFVKLTAVKLPSESINLIADK